MKKLFFLIPTLLLTVALNAAVINITPTSPHSSNNLRQAIAEASTGDIIEMETGTYVEKGNWIAFDDKEVTVRAAEGADVIIKPQFSVRVKAPNAAAKAEFIGVKFDCSALESSELFVPSDDQANQRIVLNNCEFYDWSANSALIHSTSERRLDVINIDNCYFHDFEKSIVFVENSNLVSLNITNSTFANISGSATDSYWAAPIYVKATSGSVLVDHCTFFNVNSMGIGYGAITVDNIANPTVSNCIFMLPATADRCATNLKAGGEVKYTLTYNYDNWQPYGHYNTATVTDCAKANPLFKDAANGDFSLYASSPARGASDDNSDLGDPRWYKALAPIAIPATLVPSDALLSEKASIIQSTPDSIFLKTESTTIQEWAKWNITVVEDGLYDFTAYAKRTDPTGSQKLQIVVLNSTESETIKSNAKTDLPYECTISSGAVNLVAGNTYVIKVFNNYDWAKSKLIKVEASYAGGKTIAVPATLRAVDAIKSEHAFVNEAGELRFTDDDKTGYVREQYGKWNISVAKAGKYKFTANVNSNNGQNYRITLKSVDESATIGTWYGINNNSGEREISTELVDLTINNYVLMIEDTVKYSLGRVANIIASYEGGAVANIPGQILGEDALLEKESTGTKTMIRQENGDIKSSNNGDPTLEYALWNIDATAGKFEVTLNLDPVASSGHNYRIELYEGNTLVDYSEELVSAEPADAVHSKGDVKLAKTLTISSDGTYTLKLINRTQWSSMILHGITFTPYVAPADITMNDTDTDNSAWIAKKNNTVNVQLNRTILGGMYNTICLPFKVSYAKCKEIFGNDVELYTLGDASLSGDALTLNFNTASDIWNGTPVLIKTSSDIVNPTFTGVKIESETGASTAKDGVTFQGTFVQQEITAGSPVLLLLADNKLALPLSDKTLKGFRAYFRLANPSMVSAIKHARIVTQGQVVTAIDLVGDSKTEKVQKVFVDGQLLIIRDGVQYNTLGTRVK